MAATGAAGASVEGPHPIQEPDGMPTFRTTDDVTLAYTDEGEGRPVVLVHGYTAPGVPRGRSPSTPCWTPATGRSPSTGALTGSPRRPAHGQRMARHGRDLGELLAHLDLEDAVVVGASMGGNTLWAYVDQFGPARLRGAVIVDQTPKMLNADGWEYGFYGYDPANAGTLFAEGVPDAGRGRTVDRSAAQMLRLVERLGGPPAFRDPTAPETLPLLADHARQDWRDVVRRFPLPAAHARRAREPGLAVRARRGRRRRDAARPRPRHRGRRPRHQLRPARPVQRGAPRVPRRGRRRDLAARSAAPEAADAR